MLFRSQVSFPGNPGVQELTIKVVLVSAIGEITEETGGTALGAMAAMNAGMQSGKNRSR